MIDILRELTLRERKGCLQTTFSSNWWVLLQRHVQEAPGANDRAAVLWITGKQKGIGLVGLGLVRRLKLYREGQASHQTAMCEQENKLLEVITHSIPTCSTLPGTGTFLRGQKASEQGREGLCPHTSHRDGVQRHCAEAQSQPGEDPGRSSKDPIKKVSQRSSHGCHSGSKQD